jgi:NAD(P)-dependent dehydrogenase (short-subunit alcohol dehydrogenase family)
VTAGPFWSVSIKPKPDWTVLGSFASGMHGMTRGLALDLKPIRVNLVSPGPINTELWKTQSEDERGRRSTTVLQKRCLLAGLQNVSGHQRCVENSKLTSIIS